jgi:hypothetical protein
MRLYVSIFERSLFVNWRPNFRILEAIDPILIHRTFIIATYWKKNRIIRELSTLIFFSSFVGVIFLVHES